MPFVSGRFLDLLIDPFHISPRPQPGRFSAPLAWLALTRLADYLWLIGLRLESDLVQCLQNGVADLIDDLLPCVSLPLRQRVQCLSWVRHNKRLSWNNSHAS